MQRNKNTESPIRKVRARAMPPLLARPLRPSFSMKNRANARLAKMPTNTRATKYFMTRIIGRTPRFLQ